MDFLRQLFQNVVLRTREAYETLSLATNKISGRVGWDIRGVDQLPAQDTSRGGYACLTGGLTSQDQDGGNL